MKVFVTGASGFIGRHLVRQLLHNRWAVKVLVHKHPLPLDLRQGKIEIIRGDLANQDLLERNLKDCQVGFHLASALGGSLIPPQQFWEVNLKGTINFLQAAQKAKLDRLVFFSSAGVIGKVNPGQVAAEDYSPHPQTLYDQTKFQAEKEALNFSHRGLEIIIIRPGWVYGPEDKRTFKLFQAIAKGRFLLVGGGRAQQTPVFIHDLIRGTLLALEKGERGEIYHLTGPEVLTVREMAETIASHLNRKLPSFSLPLSPLLPLAWFFDQVFRFFHREAPLTPGKLAFFAHPKPLDCSKAQRNLGYSPQTDFHTGSRLTIDWYLAHHWLHEQDGHS